MNWLFEQRTEENDGTELSHKSDGPDEIEKLKDEVRKMKLRLEGPGEWMDSAMRTWQLELDKLKRNKQKQPVD